MLAVIESLVSKVCKSSEPKPSWPEPPTRIEVRVFNDGILRIANNVPVPFLMTCQELFIYLGLYFCRTFRVKVSLLKTDGDILRELKATDGSFQVRDLVRLIKSPVFLVEDLPSTTRRTILNRDSMAEASKMNALDELEQFSFFEQIDQLWKISRAKGEPHQGLNQLARAFHDGYFPADPTSFYPPLSTSYSYL